MSDGSTVWLDHYYRYAVCGTNEDGTLYQYMIGGWEDAELYYKRYPDKSDSHIEISEYKGK